MYLSLAHGCHKPGELLNIPGCGDLWEFLSDKIIATFLD